MNKPHRIHLVIAFLGIILVTLACAVPSGLTSTATPTGGVLGIVGGTGSKGVSSGGAGGSGGGSSGGGSGANNGGSNGSNIGNEAATPTDLTTLVDGPYTVQQIETLGGESISGTVCHVTQPFSVLSITPKVTFTFAFVPAGSQKGNFSYAYTLPSAGESHSASGTYKLSAADTKGTVLLSMTGRDHVVFKGFDGNIPVRYKFNLAPASNVGCP